MTSGVTTNPHDVTRTPGGSSSGSGAAVADHMVPVAFGTQTGGSVLRPAAYCGVFGFKPTYNAFNRRGVFPAAESLDTIGPDGALARRHRTAQRRAGTAPALAAGDADRPPRVGLCRTHALGHRAARDRRRRRGRGGAARQGRRVSQGHRAAGGIRRAAHRRARDHQQLRARRRDGARVEHPSRRRSARSCASASRSAARRRMPTTWRRSGSAKSAGRGSATSSTAATCCWRRPSTAKRRVGLAETGDPSFQAIWTILHVPALTLPTHRGPNGMPVGIQLVAQPHEDRRLFACARWVWQQLGVPDRIGYQR